jgi:hypothetical protein
MPAFGNTFMITAQASGTFDRLHGPFQGILPILSVRGTGPRELWIGLFFTLAPSPLSPCSEIHQGLPFHLPLKPCLNFRGQLPFVDDQAIDRDQVGKGVVLLHVLG